MRYNPNLDSLRAISALAVIFFHWRGLFAGGWIGVQVFFILSGFLITGILRGERRKAPGLLSYVSRFYWRRVLRLVPLYALFVVLLTIVWLTTRQPQAFPSAAPFLFTYTLNIAWMLPGYVNEPWYTHLWTLAVEWQFYLFWPFVIWWASDRLLFAMLIALIVSAPVLRWLSLAFALQLPGADMLSASIFVHACPWTQFDAFALGGLLTYKEAQVVFSSKTVAAGVMALAGFAGLGVIHFGHDVGFRSLGYPNYLPEFYQAVWGYTLINAASTVLIALALQDSVPVIAVLNHKILHHLGKISYGIYVWHAPIVAALVGYAVDKGGPVEPKSLGFLIVAIALTLGTAELSYRYYESIFLKLKGKPSTPRLT